MDVLSDATHKYLGKYMQVTWRREGTLGFNTECNLFGPNFINLGPWLQTKTFQLNCVETFWRSGNSKDFVRIGNNATDTNRIDSITVDALQTRMMRSIVGWARMEDETGEVPWHACEVECKQPYNVVLSHAGPHN